MQWGSSASALALVVAAVWAAPEVAEAGVPQCGDIRIEADAHCELRLGGGCSAGCTAGVYEKACATRGFEVCSPQCSIDPSITCTDDCSESCTSDCAEGIDVVCHDNCFPECVGECAAACESAEDSIQCRASCEATCDGECDHQCAILPPNSSCYDHCMECCHGSCRASANMQCQTQCQGITWEQCEYELQVECSASCEVQGALFCDGQYIIGGDELLACVAALTELGLDIVKDVVDEETREDIEEAEDQLEEIGDDLDTDGGLGCACQAGAAQPTPALGTALLLLGLLGLRRREE